MPGMTTPVKGKKPFNNPGTPERIWGIHNSIRGNEYQLCMTLYILLRAYNDYSRHRQDFKLHMEPTDPIVGEFDDIWLEMGGEHILIQVKHMLLPNNPSSDDPFSLYKYSDSFEKCRQIKLDRDMADAKWSYVFLTNKPMQVKARKMFEKYSNECVLNSIFDTGESLKIWNDQRNESMKKLNPSDEFCDNFILSVAHLNLHHLQKKIEAEIKKTKQMDCKLGIKFLRDELFDWVCVKENRKHKYIDREWVEQMFDKFHSEHTKDHWKTYENPVLSSIKESLKTFSCQRNQIRAIDETAYEIYEKLKYILTTGQIENAKELDENETTATENKDVAAKGGVKNIHFEQVEDSNQHQNILDESAVTQIFTLRQILQTSREFQRKDTHHLFIFFRADYETTKRDELVKLIGMANATLLQDDLRTMLNLAIKCVLNRAGFNMRGSIFARSELILCHDNEVDIIGRTFKDVENQYFTLKNEAKKVGLIIDTSKTKYMLADGKTQTGSVVIAKDRFEMVQEVIFLGSLVTWDNNCSTEIERRIKIGEGIYKDYEEILKLNSSEKISKYENQIRLNVLYGCEAWTMLTKQEDKLKKFEDKMQKDLFKGYAGPHTCIEPIMDVIIAKQVRWAGQVARMADDEPARKAVIEASFPNPESKRRNGFAKKRWFEAVNANEKEQDLCDVWARAEKELKPRNNKT